ncbi:hypothetical protein [Nostoc sp.]|uniref:hypothetical protein n=1 Tax=Nostoc sp. TaxID=1180 RepID=UPI002FF410D0
MRSLSVPRKIDDLYLFVCCSQPGKDEGQILNADIPAIAHPYICADLATCVWIQQAQFFPFYQLSVIGDRLFRNSPLHKSTPAPGASLRRLPFSLTSMPFGIEPISSTPS